MGYYFDNFEGYANGQDLIASGHWISSVTGARTAHAKDTEFGRILDVRYVFGHGRAFVYPSILSNSVNWTFDGDFLVPDAPINPHFGPGAVFDVHAGVRANPTILDAYNARSNRNRADCYEDSNLLFRWEEIEWEYDTWYGMRVTAYGTLITFRLWDLNYYAENNTAKPGPGIAGITNSEGHVYWRNVTFTWDEYYVYPDPENPGDYLVDGVNPDDDLPVVIDRDPICAEKSSKLYIFESISPGDYIVTVDRDGCETQEIEITLT